MRALSLLPLLLFSAVLPAQKLSPKETFDTVIAHSQLEHAPKPWHLKVEINYPDHTKGEVEEWFVSPEKRKISINTFDFHQTIYTKGTDRFVDGNQDAPPVVITQLLDRIHRLAPSEKDLDGAVFRRENLTFGKAKLDCIMAAAPIPKVAFIPMGLFPTYCFEPDSQTMRAAYLFGGTFFVINSTGVFLGNHIPTKIALSENDKVLAKASLVALSTFVPSSSDNFEPPATAHLQSMKVESLEAGVMSASILGKTPPVYPVSARQGHITGTVVLQAVIGRDGHIYSLKVKDSPDPDLSLAAIAAVRQWVYKPYKINGNPTEVDTTIRVNFSMSN